MTENKQYRKHFEKCLRNIQTLYDKGTEKQKKAVLATVLVFALLNSAEEKKGD
jgi:glutaredoxin 2